VAPAATGDGMRHAAARWTLVACVVTPGFDYEDFELANRDELLAAWPERRELILQLT
jgi:predicted cupin superfamily sugar epimerase